ncbi:MAG: hypothetical protein LBF97_00185 [Elusimicrobiota bacterium]|nr:hypothetical protein [Elusimicrobiota bacterium]
MVVSIDANGKHFPADLLGVENKRVHCPSLLEKENIFYTEKNRIGKEFLSMTDRRLKLCPLLEQK